MNKHQLEGMKVAILVTDGFEQSEMTDPRKALEAAGAETKIVSPKNDRVRGSRHGDPADTFTVDIPLAQAAAHEFDALLLPGGVMSPDALRINEQAVVFVQDFVKAQSARMLDADRNERASGGNGRKHCVDSIVFQAHIHERASCIQPSSGKRGQMHRQFPNSFSGREPEFH